LTASQGIARGHRNPEGQQQTLQLLHLLGEGFRLLSMYRQAAFPVYNLRARFARPAAASDPASLRPALPALLLWNGAACSRGVCPQAQPSHPCPPPPLAPPCCRSQEAIDAFRRLPAHHFQTGWVLNQVGRAHFEMVDYTEASRIFHWARLVDPTRLKGLELYSTVLWHMKREIDLSHLAQVCVERGQ
jgi:hypothetical protein